MRSTLFLSLALGIAVASTAASASETRNSPNTLTHGMAQMTLRVGETTQSQVLETFGAPNIVTLDAQGNEMWVYDRHATVSSDSSGGFSVGLGGAVAGNSASGVGGVGFGKTSSKSETSTRSMTLILKFNGSKVLADFRSRSSSF